MTPDRVDPQKSAAATPRRNLRSIGRKVGPIVFIVLFLVVVSYTHIRAERMHANLSLILLLRQLYIVPIVYAAWVYGKRGGIIAALAAAIPYMAHAETMVGANSGRTPLDNWVEVVSYMGLGLMFGILRDLEVQRGRELTRVSTELSEAYTKLEDRALQLISVQDYTSSILQSIASGVFTVSSDGSVATANPAAERILGMSEYEMVPRPLRQLFSDDDGLAADVRKVLDSQVPLVLRDVTIVTREGTRRHLQSSISRMVTGGGSGAGAVVTIEDISELRSLTDQLIRADRLAAMGELTAGVAHEVRNPLGIIRVSVQLLEDPQCDRECIHEAANVIKQEIDRLDKVIKALLDFGRPSRPMMSYIDLRTVLNDVVLFTDHFARQSSVRIQMDSMLSELPVLGDPDQLKQVFLNLVTNAVQAMEETGGTIDITAERDEHYISVVVKDSGPGIAPDELRKVFDPFFTLRSDGTGLGLTIVHRIIDAHNGRIRVASTPGDGAEFNVILPVAYNEQRQG